MKHVVLGNTMTNKDKQVAHYVVLGNTTISKDNLVVKHVVLGNTMVNKAKQVAKTIAMLAPTLLVPTLTPTKPRVEVLFMWRCIRHAIVAGVAKVLVRE